MFKKGDLFYFNKMGVDLFHYITGSMGIIATDGKKIYEHSFHSKPERVEYIVYDIIVCGQLFTDIPEEILNRITKEYEKNIK